MSKTITAIIILLCSTPSTILALIDVIREYKIDPHNISAGIIVISINLFPMSVAAYLEWTDKNGSIILAVCCMVISAISAFLYIELHTFGAVASPAFQLLSLIIIWLLIAIYRRIVPPEKKPAKQKMYVTDSEANRQISMILGMHGRGISDVGIASILNQNREMFLLDNSEWSEEKVLGVISTFNSGVQNPN